MKDRLNTLENLVSSFLSGDAVIQSGTHAPEDAAANRQCDISSPSKQDNTDTSLSSPGVEVTLTPETPYVQETGDGQVNYIDPGHWRSILEDIKEVRDHLSEMDQPLSKLESDLGMKNIEQDASFLFSSNPNANLAEILTSLPPQSICDMLLSKYFNIRFLIPGK